LKIYITAKNHSLAVGVSIAAALCTLPLPAQRADTEVLPVVVSKVFRINRAGVESFVGTLQPIKKSTVGSAVDGRVVEVLVEAGDEVGTDPAPSEAFGESELFHGQPVARLRTGTLDLEIGAAKIQYQLMENELQQLLASLPIDLNLAQTKLEESKARVAYSEAEYKRLNSLSQSAVATLEIEAALSRYRIDRQIAATAAEELNRFKAVRELRAAQAQLRVDAAKQELDRLQDQLHNHTVRAPFPGFVTQKLTEVGAWVSSGDPLLEIIQLDPIELIIDVPQSYLSRLQETLVEAPSALQIDIRFEGIERPLTGVVQRMIPQSDLKLRSFPVRIRLDNPRVGRIFLLQPGMLGRASVAVGNKREISVVKKDALVLEGGETSVVVVVTEGKNYVTRNTPVKTGISFDDWIQIEGDINENDTVVVRGNERLQSGQAVRILETLADTISD
jgi:RND family efflux transporter MFP subunit